MRYLEGHLKPVHDLVYSPDGSLLASSGWDQQNRIWDGITGESLAILERHPTHWGDRWNFSGRGESRPLAWSQQGQVLIDQGGGVPAAWNLEDPVNPEPIVLQPPPSRFLSQAHFRPRKDLGSIIAVGHLRGPQYRHRLVIWDLPTRKVTSVIELENDLNSTSENDWPRPRLPVQVSCSWRQLKFVYNYFDTCLFLGALASSSGHPEQIAHGPIGLPKLWPGDVLNHCFLGAGTQVVSSLQRIVSCRDMTDRSWPGWRTTLPNRVNRIETTSDGRCILAGDQSGVIHVLSGEDGREVGSICWMRNASIRSMAISPDGQTLAVGGVRKAISLIDLDAFR